MKYPLYQVDAFTLQRFAGNPAAVCPLDAFLPDETMQAIAAENNLSETAFFTQNNGRYHIRWFTPETEVKLCGHATLASAFVIFNILEPSRTEITFDSLSGPLIVQKIQQQNNQIIQMDFPAISVEPIDISPDIAKALGGEPIAMYRSYQDYLVIYKTPEDILAIRPDFDALLKLDLRGVIVSAPCDSYENKPLDFVSRFFVPGCGVPEDPVTGSAHCILAPFWAKQLGKSRLLAKQISKRGGEILCEVKHDRVLLSGHGVLYLKGEIEIA